MATQEVNVRQQYSVPIDRVFKFYLDHDRWSEHMPLNVRKIKDGNKEPNGVGSVRLLPIPIFPLEETVTNIIENELIEYTITKGPIVKSHKGKMKFSVDSDNSCSLIHTVEMETIIPLTSKPIVTGLKFALADFHKKVAKEFKVNPNY